MSDIEKRAREMLAEEYERNGYPQAGEKIREGYWDRHPSIVAIAAALTPPEGWVLVPVEPTPSMLRAPTKFVCGHRQETIAKMYRAMLDARPESRNVQK